VGKPCTRGGTIYIEIVADRIQLEIYQTAKPVWEPFMQWRSERFEPLG